MKSKVGRPSKYKAEYIEQARSIVSVMGSTNEELAKIFKVATSTLSLWMKENKDFSDAIRQARDVYDTQIVEASLRHRAIGYSHDDVHVSNYRGDITITPVKKHYPPDTTAAIFWLKNRQPDRWRDRQEFEHSGNIGITISEDESEL